MERVSGQAESILLARSSTAWLGVSTLGPPSPPAPRLVLT